MGVIRGKASSTSKRGAGGQSRKRLDQSSIIEELISQALASEDVYEITVTSGPLELTAQVKAPDEETALDRFGDLWNWIMEGGYSKGLLLRHPPDGNLVDQSLKVDINKVNFRNYTVRRIDAE